MAIGRISGPLLAGNLRRDGIDLAFETDLLYLDVTNNRIGIRKSTPSYELDVRGTINADNLKITYTGPGTGSAQLGKLTFNSGTIASTVGPIIVKPSGLDKIELIGDTTVTGNFHATGNITAGGDITIGDNANIDNVVFNAEINSDIIPAQDITYDLGSDTNFWASAYVDTLIANAISNQLGNISITPAGGLLEINGELRATGTNPIGTAPVVTNVLYVNMDGNDTNDGRAEDPSRACKTISGAVRSPYYRPGTLIRVASGRYLENNPILLQPDTAIIGDDLRTCSIEPINKTQDLFHVQSGCYIAQMQFLNGRSGLLPGEGYAPGTNRGAYATAYPPSVNGKKIDIYHSPYIQNCTNQSGPWLVDGTMFVPNQTIQIPTAVGTTQFAANTTTITVTTTSGVIKVGDNITSGPQTPGFANARTLLLANKEFIKDQVIAFVNTTFPTFEYERAKCARDVGLIIENVAYDAAFGGNEKSVESGLSYYDGAISLIEGQQIQTTAAINYINTLSQSIIKNEVVTRLSLATTQVRNTVLTNGDVAKDEITAGINIITNIINNGPSAAPVVFKSCGPETPLVSAEILLQANRKFLQEEVTAYVDAVYPTFVYDRGYCYRDTGLIVDAVSQDVLLGGNTKSIEAGLSYFTGSKGDSSVAEQAIVNNLTLITKIISSGTSFAPTPILGPNQGTGFSNASNLLFENKLFLQTEINAYVNSSLTLTAQQQILQYAQLGLIVDAITEDTAAGGNVNSVAVGVQYATSSTTTVAVLVRALPYMTGLCRNIVKNVKNTGLYQTLIPQITTLPAASLIEYNKAEASLDLITDIINLGPSVAPLPIAPISLTRSTSTTAYNAFRILSENRNYLAAEVTGWVDDAFGGGFDYNPDKCFRDTGLIVDSLAFDILYQGNTQAIFAGSQYYNQSEYTGKIPSQITTTTAAINYVKNITKQIVLSQPVIVNQSSSTQTTSTNIGSLASTATIELLFTTITNILNFGTVGISNRIRPNGGRSGVAEIGYAFNLIQANKQFIQDQVISFIEGDNSFEYDRAKCARDTALIVKALAQDLLFTTSSQSTFAGLQYWAQSGYAGNIANELSTTTNVINFVRDLAGEVITKTTTGSRYQNSVKQWTTGTAATVNETQIIYDEFNLIVDIIVNGTVGVSDRIIPNRLTTSTNVNILGAYDLLIANTVYIQEEVIGFIESSKSKDFIYNPVKYKQDVKNIVESVAFDLLYGGNRQSVQSGVYYFSFSNLQSTIVNQKTQTIAAYNYIKTLSDYIVTGRRVPSQYQNTVTQIISANTGTTVQASQIAASISLITNIINSGPSVASSSTSISLVRSNTAAVINSAVLLDANISFISAEVVAFIDATYTNTFDFDRAKCRRDTGFILDCVSFDLVHGGDRQSVQAGVYYYGFNTTSSVITYELAQITAAYNHIKKISRDIIRNISITRTPGNTSAQVLSGSSATIVEAEYIANSIDIITDIINTGDVDSYPKQPISLIPSTTATVVTAHTQLLANRSFIQNELIAYIDYYFARPFVFNKQKCIRDTKLIVDSVALDILYNSNSQSVFAGLQYFNQSGYTGSIASQLTTTTNAINYAKGLVQGFATPSTTATVARLFTTITNILTNGIVGISDQIVPNGLASTVVDTNTAYRTILTNKATVQQQTVDWVAANNPGFTFNTATCYRDVGHIIDSVVFDLLHGGNRQSIQAGAYYYSFNGSTNLIDAVSGSTEVPQSIAAYNQLKYLIKRVLVNEPVDRSYQVVYPQVIISAYMGVGTVIPDQEIITADAIMYLNTLSQNIIRNIPVSIVRSASTQTFYTSFEGGQYADLAVSRNYNIIADIIKYGPGVAPVAYAGTGLFATTGVSGNDVRESPKVLKVTTITGNTFLVTMSGPTVGYSEGGTLYFGQTLVFPKQDKDVPAEWAQRRVDPIGSMGGSLVDGGVVSDRSPIQSFVYDAYTQVNQGGRGIRITNNGYAQLVSVFTIFCSTAVQVDNGGICSITNSNSNFGDQCLVAKGFGKRDFSGTVFNPPFPSYQPNGEFYPNGFYPKNGLLEVFIPDVANRPHISLVMEVEPPPGYLNEQGFPGFLNAVPNMPVLTTGTNVITGIDTTGIAVGNTVYIRDQTNAQGYAATGTVVVDVNFQSVTLNKGLIKGGGNIDNPNFFTFYFCGNAYYTVLSSTLTDYRKTIGKRLIPADTVELERRAIEFVRNRVDTLVAGIVPTIPQPTRTFITNRFNIINSIITATNFTIAQGLASNPITTATPPTGYLQVINIITSTTTQIVADAIALVNSINSAGVPYSETKCKRDIRIILAEIINDLQSGGDSRAKATGLSYWQGPQVFPAGQVQLEVDSINYIRDRLTTSTGLMATLGVGINTRNFVNNRFNIINSIITATNLQSAKQVVPNPVKTGTVPDDAGLAILAINRNVDAIANDTITYINAKYNYNYDTQSIDPNERFYNDSKCKRDIALILKQIIYDIESGGDYYATFSGLSYWLMDDTHHIVELGEAVNNTALFPDGVTVNFYQRSYISASGYLFEYVGAGTNYGALPQRGVADPIQEQEVIQLDNGKVFFTSTDQNGDFRIGPGLVISQATGVLSGRTFTKSLFANMTPFILAIAG